MRHCTVNNCHNKAHARGWCSQHYNNWKRRGDPLEEPSVKHHGMTETIEYTTWTSIKTRCYNKNEPSYSYYGGRGIKMCERWLGTFGFVNFYKDMGKRPPDMNSIDRIDNDKDYSPENCRWATYYDQAQNKRMAKNNTSGVVGVSYLKPKPGSKTRTNRWYAVITRNGTRHRLGWFFTKEEAVRARLAAEELTVL